jgi:hypothetical protein
MSDDKINITVEDPMLRDIEKMASLIVSLNALKKKFEFETQEFKTMNTNTGVLIDKITNYLLTKKLP